MLLIHGEARRITTALSRSRATACIRPSEAMAVWRAWSSSPSKLTAIAGKETIEHVLWEKMAWLNKYVKNGGAPAH